MQGLVIYKHMVARRRWLDARRSIPLPPVSVGLYADVAQLVVFVDRKLIMRPEGTYVNAKTVIEFIEMNTINANIDLSI